MTDDPKAFVSYSWTSAEHQQWVLDLAAQLRENGVDIIIDKWDLKEGHDAIAFMEKMVTDPDIKKVIIVLDRVYSEKADGRRGGVGTETQIISPEIYAKADQNKFVGVASETGDDGRPFLPAFYKSRIYIDLSQSGIYATNFEQLVRWIYDKPAHPKPPLGKRPEFLNENSIQLPTRSRATRAIELLRSGSPQATGALEEYLTVLAESLETLRIPINSFTQTEFDEQIVRNIESFLPFRDEFINVISTVARYDIPDSEKFLRAFFEKAIPYMFRPKSLTHYYPWYWDNFKFIIHEMFLYTISLLLKKERFEIVLRLMSQGYYVGNVLDASYEPMQQFDVMRQYMESLVHRNKRLNLRRLSVRADMLEYRSHASGLPFDDIMQADFMLYFFNSIRAYKEQRQQRWWPETLLYYREYGPFEIFARSESLQFFEKVCPLIAVKNKDELEGSFKLFGLQDAPIYLPHWEHQSISLRLAMNFEKLASKP